MAILQRPTRSTGSRDAIPTVARLHRVKRCTGIAQTTLRRQRCSIYADTALNGRPLCRQHLAQELLPDCAQRVGAGSDDAGLVRDVLRQVLDVLHAGVPDPTATDQVLAVVPAAVIARLEDLLRRG